MNRKLLVYLGWGCVFLLMGVVGLFGEEGMGAVGQVAAVDDVTMGLVLRIVVYLMLLGVIGVVVVYFFKQGRFVRGVVGNKKGSQLKVCETHTLGNKQFLVVVEYGEQRVLLGIGPGMIKKLCYLNKRENAIRVKRKEGEDED